MSNIQKNLGFCLGFDHSHCNLGSDPIWPDVGPGDEISTKKSTKTKISWKLAPDPEAYQIFTRDYEKQEDGSENKKSWFFSRIVWFWSPKVRAGRSEQRAH